MGFYSGASYNGDEMTYKSIPSSNIVDISPSAIRSPKTFVMGGGQKTITQLIKSLFSNNEVGFAYDPSDLTTLYQDAVGNIPVTAAGQPVGLMLDKSNGLVLGVEKKGTATTQLTGAAPAATYNQVTGVGTVTRADFSNQSYVRISGLNQSHYKVVVKNTGTNNIFLRSGADSGSTIVLSLDVGKSATIFIIPGGGAVSITAGVGVASFTLESIKELAGNHAYQTTSSMRPLLQNSPRKIDYDEVDDKLITNLPTQLTGCTVIRAVPNVGTQILTNQTIPTPYNDSTDHCGLIVINRALTTAETAQITQLFNKAAGV